MFKVEITYGMEHYQVERRSFDNEIDAMEYYNREVKSNPLGAKVYQEIASHSYIRNT